jgi:large subunit ribosomal protein L30
MSRERRPFVIDNLKFVIVKIMAKKTEKTSGGNITIQYYKSTIGYSKKQKDIVRGLGITKLNQTVTRQDTPSMRGIVNKIPHLLRIVE